jgi:hypothetical protein
MPSSPDELAHLVAVKAFEQEPTGKSVSGVTGRRLSTLR